MKNHPKFALIALAIAAALPTVSAQAMELKDAASKAVLGNPEVQAKWHQFQAAGHERDVIWGRFLPTLDVVLGIAREERSQPNAASTNLTRDGSTVTLRQNIFNGFGTTNDTKRLEHAKRVRYFELLDLSENAALEAARAYLDVQRFRRLLELTEDNYAVHRVVYEQIKERSESGVGRRVDLELAGGRLALAEANLLTDSASLHDVSARFQRIVGVPPKEVGETTPKALTSGLPPSAQEGLKQTLGRSPALLAAMENIQASQKDLEVQKAPFYPRLDFKAETTRGHDFEGISGKHKTDVMELAVSWNVFNGFADRSRTRQFAELINVAKDQRDKVCRDIRQTFQIAYNDTGKLTQQLVFLDQHQLSTDKAREAFHRQFDIGQRTLLDVLDTENEFFEARRAYINAEVDLNIAGARAQAASGNLLKTLGLTPLEAGEPNQVDQPSEEVLARCPEEGTPMPTTDKERLFQRAMEKVKLTRPAAPASAAPAAANK